MVAVYRPGETIYVPPQRNGVRLAGGGGSNWWQSADFAGVDWRAIYQPYGAASQALSYKNLVSPGVNDAAPGTAPAWTADGGWAFTAASSQYLTTGITPAANWTLMVWYRDAVDGGCAVGSRNGNQDGQFFAYPLLSSSRAYGNGGGFAVASALTQGMMAAVPGTAYYDGFSEGTITAGTTTGWRPIVIGARNASGTNGSYFSGKVLAVAIAASALSAAQVKAATTAMYARLVTGTPDIYVMAGQSNMSGRGTNNQSYSHSSIFALNYDNAGVLRNLRDPYDANTDQLDSVSSDVAGNMGSWIPLLASQILAETGRTCIFVPTAKGGSSITEWQPGADHTDRTTLYGSMIYRARQAQRYGTLRCVDWMQGETDALASMSQATYNGYLDTLANAVMADLGVPLMVSKMQTCGGIPDADEARINAAIAEAWGDNSNVVAGPDLASITTDSGDGLHLLADAKLQAVADAWFTAKSVAGML